MPTYEMKITVELKGDEKTMLKGYDSLRRVLESLQTEEKLDVLLSEPRPLEELPPEITKWVLAEKRKLSFKELTLAILYLRNKEGLTKAELEAEGGRVGANTGEYHEWLDKTLMSSHGGVKGFVLSTTLKTGAGSYSLSMHGKREAKMLLDRIRKQYSQ